MTATARGKGNKTVKKTASFTTVQPEQTVFPSFFPPPSITTVGVGQPIAVIFDKPPVDRVAAERALKVTATPATDRTLSLTIGPAKVATIDDVTHQMTVTVDGQVVQTVPVSMGRPGSTTVNGKTISFVTPSGTYVAQEKYEVKQMTSASYGLPNDDALGYDSQIPLAVRISNSGIFVHAAPWSVGDQGVRNVSHGCVNLSPEAGRWFYDNFGYGDVVTIRNTSTQLAPTDGFGDWNIPWDEWLMGSALN